MHVVFGACPFARALATDLARRDAAILATTGAPVEGPFLWRHADPATGEGVRQAVEGAREVHVVAEGLGPSDGLFLLLRKAQRLRGSVVVPLGERSPGGLAACRGLSLLHLGPTWGPEEPWVEAWDARLRAGGRLWVPDPGEIRPVATSDAVQAVRAVAECAQAHWTVAGERAVRMRDLAEAVAARAGVPLRSMRVPLGWAAWREGLDAERVRAWVGAPAAPTVADGWRPEPAAAPRGWLAAR